MAGLNDGQERPPEVTRTEEPTLCIIGIGASSGGLAALKALFDAVPAAPGVAFVVVTHLSPDHESHLAELLQPHTHLPVRQVRDSIKLEADCVYVIPPNANLTAVDTHLRLSALELQRRRRAPIDHFLRTLANAHAGRAVGVILSGDASDGSLGLRHVRQQGGLAIAQDPEEAECDSMPRSAIRNDAVDRVLPVALIAVSALAFCAARPRLSLDDTQLSEHDNALLDAVLAEIEHCTAHELQVYRRALILRHIRRRMRIAQIQEFAVYLDFLREHTDETQALHDEIVTNVSEFFQDPLLVRALQEELLPPLFDQKNGGSSLRAWSVGCSTGEDAYSLAILLLEEAERRASPPAVQVFASDLSPELLGRARIGVYPREVAATVPETWLRRYFTEDDGRFRVRRELRDTIIFSEHSIFKDPPFARIALIECRSLLAELQRPIRRAVLEMFHFALEPHGVLIVAPDDPIHEPLLFEWHDRQRGVLRRLDGYRSSLARDSVVAAVKRRRASEGHDANTVAALAALHFRMVERFIPASVLVDADNEIVHYSSAAARYIRIPGGEPTHGLFELVMPSLVSELRAALAAVRRSGMAQLSPPLRVELDGKPRELEVEVHPSGPDTNDLVLVAFKEVAGLVPESDPAAEGGHAKAIEALAVDLERARDRVARLIASHAQDTEVLQTDNSGLARTNQDLMAVLDAVQASHEELQATNRKLTELDSANRRRFHELAQLSRDLHHLLESTGLATIFLDDELRLVRFTPQICDVFSIHQSDIGRPISEFNHSLLQQSIWEDARAVLERETALDREVESTEGRWYLCRMLPYRNARDVVEGVALTLVDITGRKEMERRLRESDRRKDEFLAVLAHELRNPLAPIVTGLDVLNSAGERPDLVARISATMARQARQLVRIVDDLLEVSRVTGGRLQLRIATVALNDVVDDAVESIKPAIDARQHQLSVVLPTERIMLEADGARLTQVFANMLSNAARYTEPGGKVDFEARVDGAQLLVVTVRDTGIGLAPESLERIFEMFYKHDDSPMPEGVSLGIGLTLARSLVEMHGGTISATSAGRDQGSEFTVTLPIVKTSIERDCGRGVAPNRNLGGHRILIVDDNRDAAQTLKVLISMLGDNECELAFSGVDALHIASRWHPDIVLLDLKMPDMDGYEVARRLRSADWGKDMLLVAVSGWASDEHKLRAQSVGFGCHLSKPVARTELEAVLERVDGSASSD